MHLLDRTVNSMRFNVIVLSNSRYILNILLLISELKRILWEFIPIGIPPGDLRRKLRNVHFQIHLALKYEGSYSLYFTVHLVDYFRVSNLLLFFDLKFALG